MQDCQWLRNREEKRPMTEHAFEKAYWERPGLAVVFLARDWHKDPIELPIVIEGMKCSCQWEPMTPMEVAAITGYCELQGHWVFVCDPVHMANVDPGEELFVAGSFNRWGDAVGDPAYRMVSAEAGQGGVRICSVPLSEIRSGEEVRFRFVTASGRWLPIPRRTPNWAQNPFGGGDYVLFEMRTGRHGFRLLLDHPVPGDRLMRLVWQDEARRSDILVDPSEHHLQMASDQPLGAILDHGKVRFCLFAPRAGGVQVALGRNPDLSDRKLHKMNPDVDGTWSCDVQGDWAGAYYVYHVDGHNADASTFFDMVFPIVDPYARAMVSPSGPGIIVAGEQPAPKDWQPPCWHDLVIAEIHVRDAIAQADFDLDPLERRGFSGFTRWIRQEGNYLRTLGVNAIELQPIQEFEYGNPEEYHWGYMPVNYFSLSSAYTRDPSTASGVAEFREMVDACHEQGFAVILDVVYNHLGEPNALYRIDKQYYFELDTNNDPTNWSGVGNDIRASGPMVRRLIIDSLVHLVTAYGVDGFRFDLAELLGRSLLVDIERKLKSVKPSVVLIAEPWSFRGHIAEELKSTGFSSWNDSFREYIPLYLKGSVSSDGLKWFIQGAPGRLTRFPAQTVNYAESHDDHAWIDVMTENPDRNGSNPTQMDRWRNHLMVSMLMVSLGIPMLSAGQDFLRSKQGVRNTYQRGDLNALDYERLRQYAGSHAYASAWIRFRLSEDGRVLRQDSAPGEGFFHWLIPNDSRALGVVFNADHSRPGRRLIYAINPDGHPVSLPSVGFSMDGFVQVADHERWSLNGLDEWPFSCVNGSVNLPPISCGLWMES